MKSSIVSGALALSLSLGVGPLALAGVGKGQKAPDFALPTLKGGKLSLASLRGKVVVLDFWAQWCEPCKRELPELEKLSKAYAGKDVAFVSINIDKQRDNAARLAQQLGLTFDVGLDPAGSVAGQYDLPKMPTSFVIDKKGVVRYVHEGFEGAGDVERFKKEIDELLSK
jgi:peroxiredoxin